MSARQIQVRTYRIGCDNDLNKFGDYDVIVHAMSRNVSGTTLGETMQTFVMLSSIGAPPVALSEAQFKDAIVNAVFSNTKPVEFPAI